jgi:hypothetical protein
MHGMNIQVLAAPDGAPLWSSGSLPGSAHDLKAARIWGLILRCCPLRAGQLVKAILTLQMREAG